MVEQAEVTVHTLVVTGPERDRLYERFRRLFYGRDDVEVIKDRRSGERRRARLSADAERRHRERRHARPDWVVPPD